MKRKIGLSTFIALFLILAVYHFKPEALNLFEFYRDNLRPALFTGFLTFGIFLLSLKTFIVIKMKESVYDHERYLEDFERLKKTNSKLKLYAPLQNLSNLLYISVLSAITTSVSQFTVGLINSEYSVYFCLGLAAFTLSMVFLSLFEFFHCQLLQ